MIRNTKSHISMRGGPEVGVGEGLGCSETAQAITEAGGTEGCWGGGVAQRGTLVNKFLWLSPACAHLLDAPPQEMRSGFPHRESAVVSSHPPCKL